MEAVVFVLVFVVLWAWIEIIRSKEAFKQQLATLMNRIWKLEKQMETLQSQPATHRQPAPEPAHQSEPVPAAPPIPQPVFHAPPPPVPHVEPAHVAPPAPSVVHTPPPVPAFTASAPPLPPPPAPHVHMPPPPPASPSPRSAPVDWEALIGGNLLNKIGALLLVIGIMSFLAYYGTQMGPAGRAGCSVLVSLVLLGAGVGLERNETYRMFALGLIGAGWAALYATAFAIYALPAARIIDNPFVGSFIVLLVAGGMIAHSLRYQSQGVTAVAFFSAFAALAITPNTLFAVLCLIPLAAAVLYLAQRFNWYHMALMGVAATYGACAWRGSSNAPLYETELLFIGYWVLFEVFDLMRFARRVGGWSVELIFPLNAAGFLGLSFVSWTSKAPDTIWMFSACAAALYLVDTLWRVKIELDLAEQGTAVPTAIPDRIRAGTFEAPLSLAAFLSAAAVVEKITGLWISIALATEAQALFAAGMRFRSRFLRGLAMVGFACSILAIFGDPHYNSLVNVAGHMTHKWVFVALFHVLLFYVNRAMSESGSFVGTGFSWAGSFLLAVVVGNELPEVYAGFGCMLLGTLLFEFGNARKLKEFRQQGYASLFCGSLGALTYISEAKGNPWIPLALSTGLTYLAALRVGLLENRDQQAGRDVREWVFAEWCASALTALSATVLMVKHISDDNIGVALWGLALVLLELGLQRLPTRLRFFAHPVAAMAFIATLGHAPNNPVKPAPPHIWLPFFGAAAAAMIMSGRISIASQELVTRVERGVARNLLSGAGLLFALIAFWVAVPDEFVPAAWAVLAIAVLFAGNALDVLAWRLEAHAIAVFAGFSAFAMAIPEGHAHRLLAVALLIAAYAALRVLSLPREGFEQSAPLVHEGAAGILAAALIYQEVSGGMLTIGWGAEALALLGLGFVFRERPLRLEGLGLFLVCVLKLFLYDLRNLETPYRILSFIALGLILLGVSWVYTRFREQLQKLL
jgi:hypothetical protein